MASCHPTIVPAIPLSSPIMTNPLDLIVKGSFQTATDGSRHFYPNGFAGPGYGIDTDALYQQLFSQQKRWAAVIISLISLLVLLQAGWKIILPCFIMLNLGKQWAVRRATRPLTLSPRAYSIDSYFAQVLRLPALPIPALRLICSLSALLSLGLLSLIALRLLGWHRYLGTAFCLALLAYLALRELLGLNPPRP